MQGNIVEVTVTGLAVDERNQSPVVLLKESGGDRVLPIWIGEGEARAIALELTGKKFSRPLTHDLMMAMLEGLHARVERVVISELRENTFFAVILLAKGAEFASIDARPSDSIALALRAKASIFVADELLVAEGSEPGAGRPAPPPPPTEEERAAELRRYLEGLNPEDFGKFNP